MLTLQKRKLEFSTQITHSVVFVTTHFRNIINIYYIFCDKKKLKHTSVVTLIRNIMRIMSAIRVIKLKKLQGKELR